MIEQKKVLHMIGNAHLDPVWLWRWQEGYAEIKATFRSALDRMKEYPDFIFTCACAAYYEWVEMNEPSMFAEIKERVKEGRWVIVGGWWIQPDCNLPSGESFVRHALYSQRYFAEKFGVMSKVGYNVDSFGHHGNLPQILKKSGMDYYVFMRPDPREKELPASVFWWESLDGSRVLAYRIPIMYGNYGMKLPEKIKTVFAMSERESVDMMLFYGVGNHGGGPTIKDVNTILQWPDETERERLSFSSPNAYFSSVLKDAEQFPVVREDLQHHASGCYSAHSETKALNRRTEFRLVTAEKWAALSHQLTGLSSFAPEIGNAWKSLMFNQFHDILGGCSIKEAYEDSKEAFGFSLHTSAQVMNASIQKISWSIDTSKPSTSSLSKEKDWVLWEQENLGAPIVLFNSLSWEVTAPVTVTRKIAGVTNDENKPVPVQTVRASRTNRDDLWDTLFYATVPPMGYRVYWMYRDQTHEISPSTKVKTNGSTLENDYIRLEFDVSKGCISKLIDKNSGISVFAGNAALPKVIDEYKSDTWSHGIFKFDDVVGMLGDASVEVLEHGPLRARTRITSFYNKSVIQQDFIVYHDRPDIHVKVKLDWRERHKMLKISFPVNFNEPRITYEIPYGHIEKQANGEEEPGHNWVSLHGLHYDTSRAYSLSLLNNGKYSFSAFNNELTLTAARSPIYADHYATQRDSWCEYMDQGVQEFEYVLVPHEGLWNTNRIVQKSIELNVALEAIKETYHKGPLNREYQGISISSPNVLATVFKVAEDHDGYVLRCYECNGIPSLAEINLTSLHRQWTSKFSSNEIKTFHIPYDDTLPIKELNLLEM